jgi:hypothetical protein
VSGWAIVTRDRDYRVRAAAEAGVTRYRIEQLTGLAKTTIIRILRADGSQDAIDGSGEA